MTIDATAFRGMFPEFASTVQYSDAQILAWLTIAYDSFNACRFGASLDMAVALFTAHNLVLGANNVNVANNGGVPGTVTGPVTSQSAGHVSQSYNVTAMLLSGAGEFNGTSYGIRFWTLVRAKKIGGVYVIAGR